MTSKINKFYTYEAFFDGSATPNPGQMQIGGYIEGQNGRNLCEYSESMGMGSNNEAEYLSLIRLIHEISRRGINKVKIYGDSQLIVNQVNGVWKARDPRMRVLRDRARDGLAKIKKWSLTHIKRKHNKEADSLT